jgi:hypothetical protein
LSARLKKFPWRYSATSDRIENERGERAEKIIEPSQSLDLDGRELRSKMNLPARRNGTGAGQ